MANNTREGLVDRIKRTLREYGTGVAELIAPSYRPELHYMRGPGPASARHARSARPTR